MTLTHILGDSQNITHRNFGDVLKLDGVNDYLVNTSFDFTDIFRPDRPSTLSFWIYPITPGSIRPVRGTHFMAIKQTSTFRDRFYVQYGNTSDSSLLLVYETSQSPNNFRGVNFNITSANFKYNRWNHIAITHDGTLSFTNTQAYLNSKKLPKISTTPVITFSGSGTTTVRNTLIAKDWNDLDVCGMKTAEIHLTSNYCTESDIRDIYNYSTTGNFLNYPANLVNNSFLHLPLNSSNISVVGSQLIANNLSNPSASFEILGQGLTPTLESFYL